MKNTVIHRVEGVKNRWLIIYLLETLILSAAVALLVGALSKFLLPDFSWLLSTASIAVTLPLFYFTRNHKRVTVVNVLRLMSVQNETFEHSTDLILKNEDQLTNLEELQLEYIHQRMLTDQSKLKLPNSVKNIFMILIGCAVFFLLSSYIETSSPSQQIITDDENSEQLSSSIAVEIAQKGIKSFEVVISPPKYTGLKRITQEERDLRVAEGSVINWKIEFYEQVSDVKLRLSDKRVIKLNSKRSVYSTSLVAQERMFYELLYTDESGKVVYSDFYKIDIVYDIPPSIELIGLNQYTEIEYDGDKEFDLSATITDDYGLSDAYIIATVAQGSGESVMFREDKLQFDRKFKISTKDITLPKRFDLNEIGMEPGDELYFYVEAKDNSTLKNNMARTETYIISIQDTSTYVSNMEGGLGIDLMPEYFRSQRQIIIDTEKLIANKSNLTAHEFNSGSNELGFDQKALRLKYGQFMGVEDESGIAIEDHEAEEEHNDVIEGDEQAEDDPLDGFKHDHDSEDEHSRVNEGEEHEEDPLDEYQHAHDSEEVATFFTNTLKGKLRAAMSLMWDSELYLRLYQPENSLPYQYKALKLIKEIKNHARVYVHRIGFDPPPIKEESRLSADLSEVIDNEVSIYDTLESHPNIKEVVKLLNQKQATDSISKELLQLAGNELAQRALDNPGKYLKGLQMLRAWINSGFINDASQLKLKSELIKSLPYTELVIESENAKLNDMSKTYLHLLDELQDNERR